LKSKELCGIDAEEYKVLKMLPSGWRSEMKLMHRISKVCNNNKLSTPIARQALSTKQAFRIVYIRNSLYGWHAFFNLQLCKENAIFQSTIG
jgi:hypothetical protein